MHDRRSDRQVARRMMIGAVRLWMILFVLVAMVLSIAVSILLFKYLLSYTYES